MPERADCRLSKKAFFPIPIEVMGPNPVITTHLAAAADLFDAIQRGILDVGPSRDYGLDDIVTAHHDLEGRRITGAGIVIP
jgi:NADPH:quinone reductase-like Zn-dependent oxidoreductase